VDLLAVNLRIVAQKISGKFSHHISFCIGGGGGKRDSPHQVYRWDTHNPFRRVIMRNGHGRDDHVIYDIHFVSSNSRIIIPNI
jgi:hypothetical protein